MRTAGFWPPDERHEADARKLRHLLGEARVREIMDLRQRQRLGGQRERQDRGVGGVDLAVDGRIRQVPRQIGAGRVDRGLDLLLGDVDVEVERELQRDDRGAVGGGRGHLVQARDLAELALERGRHRGGHDLGPRARVEGHDLDRRVVDLRERRNGKLPVGDDAGEQQARHQERGRDRPEDEGTRRAQEGLGEALRSPAFRATTFDPFWSLSTPSTTTTSPAATPRVTTAARPLEEPTSTGRMATVPPASTT